MRASHCGDFSCCRAWALGVLASVVVACRRSSCSFWALECRLSSCGTRAQLLRGRWDLPGPGLVPVSPALAGRFLTTEPPGKSPPHPTLKFLPFGIVHIEPPVICQLQFRFSYLGTGYPRCLCLWVSLLVGCDSLYSPIFLSNLGASGLHCDLTSQMDLRSIDFLRFLFSDFYLLLRWGDDF